MVSPSRFPTPDQEQLSPLEELLDSQAYREALANPGETYRHINKKLWRWVVFLAIALGVLWSIFIVVYDSPAALGDGLTYFFTYVFVLVLFSTLSSCIIALIPFSTWSWAYRFERICWIMLLGGLGISLLAMLAIWIFVLVGQL